MITVTELRIFAFALSLSQEDQGKHILLSTVIQTPVTFLLRSPFGSNVPDYPLVSISSAELWAISSTKGKFYWFMFTPCKLNTCIYEQLMGYKVNSWTRCAKQ